MIVSKSIIFSTLTGAFILGFFSCVHCSFRIDYCMGDQFPGVYSRDMLHLRCCKQHFLKSPKSLELASLDEWNCFSNVVQDNPDDDLATSMWKIQACKIKNLVKSQDDQLSYKPMVDFLTKHYTIENNVQSLIKNSSTECPEGDKESEDHKKIQAYLTCFYKNEQQICEEQWTNTTTYKTHFFTQNNLTDKTCGGETIPGIWDQKQFCCNGMQTPEKWSNHMYTKYYKNLTILSECMSGIYKFRKAKNSGYNQLPPNPSEEDFTKHADHEYPFNCVDACSLNPVIFSNYTTTITIDLDTDSALDQAFSAFTTKVKNNLKSYFLKRKSTARVPFTQAQYINGTGIALEEIEKQFSSSKDIEKLKFYCGYYRVLAELVVGAFKNYCIPN